MKLPQISGLDLVKKLCKNGFVVVRQKGSHIRLEKNTPDGTIKITIPNHPSLKKGTLHQILKAASLNPEELLKD